MKKRKPPIVLISVIVLMLIGVAIMNSPNNDNGKKQEDVVQDSRKTDSAADMASTQKNLVSKAGLKNAPSTHHPLTEEQIDKMHSGIPAIKVAKPNEGAKMTPNDSSQIGQWYSDESAASGPKPNITVSSPPR